MEERIYAGIASALKAAAAQHTSSKSGTANQASARFGASSGAGTGGSPLQLSRPGELAAAAAADALSAQCSEAPIASTVAAAMQELAAATAAEQLGQQLQQQMQHLEQEVEGLKQRVTVRLTSADGQQPQLQQLQQQLANQQAGMQQLLSLGAGVWQDQLQQQQELVAALTTEVRELQQQQQRPATPAMEALLDDLRQQAQQQIAHLGKQQVRMARFAFACQRGAAADCAPAHAHQHTTGMNLVAQRDNALADTVCALSWWPKRGAHLYEVVRWCLCRRSACHCCWKI